MVRLFQLFFTRKSVSFVISHSGLRTLMNSSISHRSDTRVGSLHHSLRPRRPRPSPSPTSTSLSVQCHPCNPGTYRLPRPLLPSSSSSPLYSRDVVYDPHDDRLLKICLGSVKVPRSSSSSPPGPESPFKYPLTFFLHLYLNTDSHLAPRPPCPTASCPRLCRDSSTLRPHPDSRPGHRRCRRLRVKRVF